MNFKQVAIAGAMFLLVASCSGDDEASDETTSSTTSGVPITTLAGSTEAIGTSTADTTTSTTTTTVPSELSVPQYSIISREASELGDIVVVLLDTDTYESLSDLDIHNVMSDLVEEHAPVYQAHIVESEAAADALFVDEPTEAEQNALDNHYLARLEEGFRIVYVGPLEDSGIAILGS